jgi:hypothetical protein
MVPYMVTTWFAYYPATPLPKPPYPSKPSSTYTQGYIVAFELLFEYREKKVKKQKTFRAPPKGARIWSRPTM